MKKLLFIGAYPPPYGGIASHLKELAPQLIKDGYRVTILSPSSSDRQVENDGLKVIHFDRRRYFHENILSILATFIGALKYKADMRIADFIKELPLAHKISVVIKEEGIDALFIYDNYNGLVIPILKKHYQLSVPIAFMIFGDFYLYPDRYRAIPKYMKCAFEGSDIVMSSSHYCASSISKVLDHEFPVKVIYVGVDHRKYIPTIKRGSIRRDLGIPDDSLVFLFLGRMVKDMGIDFLLRNIERLLSIDPKIYLILSGAYGDFSAQAEEMSRNDPKIKYCPNIPFDEKPYYFAASDVFIAPTMEKHACMGVSIKEAMSCGRPVIASDSGGIPEAITDGYEGYLIPFKNGELDADVFIEKVKRLSEDTELQRMMGERGRAKAMKIFSNDLTVQSYREVLNELNV